MGESGKRSWWKALGMAFPFLCLMGCDETGSLTPEEAKLFLEKAKGVQLVDVRTVAEYRQGYLPKAMNIPLVDFENSLSKFPKDQPLLLYCRSGNRSSVALNQAKRRGYKQVFHIKGGILAWEEAGFTVLK